MRGRERQSTRGREGKILREIEGKTGIDGGVREIAEKWVLQRYNQGPKVQKISQGEEKRSKGKNKQKQSEQDSFEENKPW